jgi:predicted MPP superfamily phosphohydrolase
MKRGFFLSFIILFTFSILYFRFLSFFKGSPLLAFGPWVTVLLSLGFLSWLFFSFWVSSDSKVSAPQLFLERAAHLSLGYLSFLITFVFLRESALSLRWISASFESLSVLRSPEASFILFLVACACVLAGFLIAMRGPRVHSVRIPLSTELDGSPLRIVQVSDLHLGSWIGERYVRIVVDRINALGNFDLLVFTGDIGDGDPERHSKHLQLFDQIRPALGKFAVSGNHEGYWDEQAWNEALKQRGFTLLENSGVRLRNGKNWVGIAGISDSNPHVADALKSLERSTSSEEGAINILLAHQPFHADEVAKIPHHPIHLQLSGHTHSGQFIPWSWIIGWFQRYPSGLFSLGSFFLYVNVGTGFWGAPLRLGTRSEITLIEAAGKES